MAAATLTMVATHDEGLTLNGAAADAGVVEAVARPDIVVIPSYAKGPGCSADARRVTSSRNYIEHISVQKVEVHLASAGTRDPIPNRHHS